MVWAEWCEFKRLDGIEIVWRINPYNLVLVDAAQTTADTPQEQMQFWKLFQATLAAVGGKPGCRSEGLYNQTVRKKMFGRMAELPVPEDRPALREVLAFLEAEKCDVPAALVTYRLALEGLPALLSRTRQEFKDHLDSVRNTASRENDLACAKMATTIKSTADRIPDRKQKNNGPWAYGNRQAGTKNTLGTSIGSPPMPPCRCWSGSAVERCRRNQS